eukprot:m.33582 g.33582  ORF g.33582 m.33582 type:complete len:1447 (-) comp9643_c0_seq1:572-4912(-)
MQNTESPPFQEYSVHLKPVQAPKLLIQGFRGDEGPALNMYIAYQAFRVFLYSLSVCMYTACQIYDEINNTRLPPAERTPKFHIDCGPMTVPMYIILAFCFLDSAVRLSLRVTGSLHYTDIFNVGFLVLVMLRVFNPDYETVTIPTFLHIWSIREALKLLMAGIWRRLARKSDVDRSSDSHHLTFLLTSLAAIIITAVYGVETIEKNEFTLFTACWFTIVTFSTVGYGDYTPVSLAGRLFVMGMIIVALVMIPDQIAQISQARALRRKHGGHFKRKRVLSTRRHVVLITGRIQSDTLEDFLMEMRPRKVGYAVDVVIISPFEAPPEVHQLISKSGSTETIRFLIGSALNPVDLQRADIRHAEAVFIVAENYLVTDASTSDQHSILRAWAVREFAPNVPVFVQVSLLEHVGHVKFATETMCIDELRYSLLAISALCPGAGTLLTSLAHNVEREGDSFDHNNLEDSSKLSDPLALYEMSTQNSIFECSLGDSRVFKFYAGEKFDVAAADAIEKKICFLGIRRLQQDSSERTLILNPIGKTLRTNDICVYICRVREDELIIKKRDTPPAATEPNVGDLIDVVPAAEMINGVGDSPASSITDSSVSAAANHKSTEGAQVNSVVESSNGSSPIDAPTSTPQTEPNPVDRSPSLYSVDDEGPASDVGLTVDPSPAVVTAPASPTPAVVPSGGPSMESIDTDEDDVHHRSRSTSWSVAERESRILGLKRSELAQQRRVISDDTVDESFLQDSQSQQMPPLVEESVTAPVAPDKEAANDPAVAASSQQDDVSGGSLELRQARLQRALSGDEAAKSASTPSRETAAREQQQQQQRSRGPARSACLQRQAEVQNPDDISDGTVSSSNMMLEQLASEHFIHDNVTSDQPGLHIHDSGASYPFPRSTSSVSLRRPLRSRSSSPASAESESDGLRPSNQPSSAAHQLSPAADDDDTFDIGRPRPTTLVPVGTRGHALAPSTPAEDEVDAALKHLTVQARMSRHDMYFDSPEYICHFVEYRAEGEDQAVRIARPLSDLNLNWVHITRLAPFRGTGDNRSRPQQFVTIAVPEGELGSGMYHFIRTLRSALLDPDRLVPIVIVINPQDTMSDRLQKFIAQFPYVYYTPGEIHNPRTLLRAVLAASRAVLVVASREDKSHSSNTDGEDGMIDCVNVLSAKTTHQEYPQAPIIVELAKRANVKFVRLRRSESRNVHQGPSNVQSLSESERSTPTDELWKKRFRHHIVGSIRSFVFRIPYAQGSVFTTTMLDAILYQSMCQGKGCVMSVFRMLLGCDYSRSYLSVVQLKGWSQRKLRTYGDVVRDFIRRNKQLPIGLRVDRTLPNNDTLTFVLPNPDDNMEVEDGDFVYVLQRRHRWNAQEGEHLQDLNVTSSQLAALLFKRRGSKRRSSLSSIALHYGQLWRSKARERRLERNGKLIPPRSMDAISRQVSFGQIRFRQTVSESSV